MKRDSKPKTHRSSPVTADSVIAFLRPAVGKLYVSNSGRNRVAKIYGVKNPASKRWTLLRRGNPKITVDVIAVRGNVGRNLQKADGMVEERVRQGYECGDGKGPESEPCHQIHEDEWRSCEFAGYGRCVAAPDKVCHEARVSIGTCKVYSAPGCHEEDLKRTTNMVRWVCID